MLKKIYLVFIMPIILFISCVETNIFIQLYPDGNAYFKFISRGDSTDIFNNDFIHPKNLSGWTNNIQKLINQETNDHNWRLSTEGMNSDSVIIFVDDQESSLNYSFSKIIKEKKITTEYSITFLIQGQKIKQDYPKLYEALLLDNLDSLYWLPEALTVLMHKGLLEIAHDSLSSYQELWNQRLVNHLKNSFAKITTLDDLKKIQNNREEYLTNLLKPFNVGSEFPGILAKQMEKHETILKTALDLDDDRFTLKLKLPGRIISTNANAIINDTLQWNFTLDSLLSEDFELKAASITYSIEKLQKGLISIMLLLFIISGITLKRYYKS